MSEKRKSVKQLEAEVLKLRGDNRELKEALKEIVDIMRAFASGMHKTIDDALGKNRSPTASGQTGGTVEADLEGWMAEGERLRKLVEERKDHVN
jgi:hypothetical protein